MSTILTNSVCEICRITFCSILVCIYASVELRESVIFDSAEVYMLCSVLHLVLFLLWSILPSSCGSDLFLYTLKLECIHAQTWKKHHISKMRCILHENDKFLTSISNMKSTVTKIYRLSPWYIATSTYNHQNDNHTLKIWYDSKLSYHHPSSGTKGQITFIYPSITGQGSEAIIYLCMY